MTRPIDGEAVEVVGNSAIVSVTWSLNAGAAYAIGDVLAATQELPSAMARPGGTGFWLGVTLNDKDDQGAAMDLYLLSDSRVLGVENAVPSIADDDADYILAVASVAASDWKDLGGCKVAEVALTPRLVKAESGSCSLWFAAVTQGTPTHTASGITGKFKFVRD